MAGMPKSSRHKRTKQQREADMVVIAEMLAKGKTHREIAAHISKQYPDGISESQIMYDSKKIREQWHQSILREINDLKAQAYARYDAIYKDAMRAWEVSQEESSLVTQSETMQPNGTGTEKNKKGDVKDSAKGGYKRTLVKKEKNAGGAQYLKLAMEAQEKMDKLLGLYDKSTIQIEHSGTVSHTHEVSSPKEVLRLGYEQMSEEELLIAYHNQKETIDAMGMVGQPLLEASPEDEIEDGIYTID